MHESHHLDDIVEENERFMSTPPDRRRFENDLENLHTDMENIKNQIQVRCKKCLDANPRRDELKNKKMEFRKELDHLKVDGQKISEQINGKRKTQLDLEKDCRFRNKEQLERILAEHENRYANKSLNARGEQALVNEINALKRNRTKLDTLEDLMAEKREMEKKLTEHRDQKNKIYHDITVIQNELKNNLMDRRKIENEIVNFRRELNNLKDDRKRLIDSYECDRAEYKSWVSERKGQNGNVIPMSFPTAKKTKTYVDDEELEPFYEQKRDCKRLIHYLENLKNSFQIDDVKRNSDASKIESDDDSADELPPQLAKLNVSSRQPIVHAPANRRHLKKGTQPISHNIDIYKLFGAIEVDVPKVYSDVADALKLVNEKLEFYDQQTTNEMNWEVDINDYLSVSRAASDMGSTVYEDSDVGSISSYNRTSSRTSCQSPQVESPKKHSDVNGCASQ